MHIGQVFKNLGKQQKVIIIVRFTIAKSFYESGGAISMHSFPRKGENQVKIISKLGVKEVVDRQVG